MDYKDVARFLPESASGWAFSFSCDDGSFSFNNHSPAGEDLWIEGSCGSPETALSDIKSAVDDEFSMFDVDEHVELWAQARGTRGVPSSYEVLVDDAYNIMEMLEKLNAAVLEWELPEESDRMDCPVCGTPLTAVTDAAQEFASDGGEMRRVYNCQNCFFSSFEADVKTFWGFSRKYRARLRDGMFAQYRNAMDDMYEEACNNEVQ